MLLLITAISFLIINTPLFPHKTAMSEAIEKVFHIVSGASDDEIPEKDLFISLISETYSSLIQSETFQLETFHLLETYFFLYPEAPEELHEAVQEITMNCATRGIGKMNRDELRKIVQLEKKNHEKQLEKHLSLLKKNELRTQLRAQQQEELERYRKEQRKRTEEQRHLKILQEEARKKYTENQKARKEASDRAQKAKKAKEEEEERKKKEHEEKINRQNKINKQ